MSQNTQNSYFTSPEDNPIRKYADDEIDASWLRLREENRARRAASAEIANDMPHDERIAELEAQCDALGNQLDDALKALALVKSYLDDCTTQLGIPYAKVVKFTGYSLSERVLAQHGVSALLVLAREATEHDIDLVSLDIHLSDEASPITSDIPNSIQRAINPFKRVGGES